MSKSDTDRLAVSEAEQCFPSQNTFQATVCKQKFQSFVKIQSVMLQQSSVRLVTNQDSASPASNISLNILHTGGKKQPSSPICQISGPAVKVLVVQRGFLSAATLNQGCVFSPPTLSCASLRWGWLSLLITFLLLLQWCLGFWSSLPCNHEVVKWSSPCADAKSQLGDFTKLLLVYSPGESQLIICIVILCEQ